MELDWIVNRKLDNQILLDLIGGILRKRRDMAVFDSYYRELNAFWNRQDEELLSYLENGRDDIRERLSLLNNELNEHLLNFDNEESKENAICRALIFCTYLFENKEFFNEMNWYFDVLVRKLNK